MGFELFTCDTTTGANVRTLLGSGAGWSVKLNEAGTVTAQVPVGAREVAGLDIRTMTTTVRQSLGIAYNGNILECGPIWGKKYAPDKEKLDLNAAGLWTIFDRRRTIQAVDLDNIPLPAMSVWTITKGSLGAIAREMVWDSITNNPWFGATANAGILNIVLPPDVPGTAHTRTYYGYDLAKMGTRLKELTEVDNGPDIRFRPRFTPGDSTTVEWVMEVGTATDPLLQNSGADVEWDVSVEKSGAVHLAWDEDATDLAMRAWISGAGTGKLKKIQKSTALDLIVAGWPWLEVEESRDVENPLVLYAHAVSLLNRTKRPWITWDLTVRADQTPFLGTYLPGDWAKIRIPEGHPQAPAGTVRVRIMEISGNTSEKVKLVVAPIQGTY